MSQTVAFGLRGNPDSAWKRPCAQVTSMTLPKACILYMATSLALSFARKALRESISCQVSVKSLR